MKNKINNTKIFIGPMSNNIISNVINVSNKNNTNIGLIASRRQIDHDYGYVNTTKNFVKNIRKKSDNVIVCRDHGGIKQGLKNDNGTLSFFNDKDFDLIHIDPWKKYQNIDDVIRETVDNIKFINTLNEKCLFEVGTEEAIRPYSNEELDYFLYELKKELGELFDKIVYAVIQSGTKIIGLKNTGIFNEEKCVNMINICKKHGVLSKEHNGDYLKDEDIIKRFELGLDAINIAPEFGVYETSIIYESMNMEQQEKFFNMCFESKKWVKWFPNDFNPFDNKEELIKVCGHYLFNDESFIELKKDIKDIDKKIKKELYIKIKKKIDLWK